MGNQITYDLVSTSIIYLSIYAVSTYIKLYSDADSINQWLLPSPQSDQDRLSEV